MRFGNWNIALIRIAGGVAVAVAAVLVSAGCGGGSKSATPTATARASGSSTAATVQVTATAQALKSSGAKVTLATFEDFQCPFCLQYTTQIEPTLIKEYVNTGKINYEYHNYAILGAESTKAAIAAYCAGQQDQFWKFHDLLFQAELSAGQLQGEKLNAGRFTDATLAGYAAQAGLDTTKFAACYTSPGAQQAVQADGALATSLKLQGTPTFTLNGKVINTPSSIGGWRKLLDDALAGQ